MISEGERNSVVVRRGRFVRRDNWAASWIWCEGEENLANFYLYARKAFKLSAKPVSAGIRITADSRYKLFVNGTFVGRGPANSVPGISQYDSYDISEHLVKGQNVIAVLVNSIGEGTHSYIPGKPGLLCEADIDFEDGHEKIVTDETWKVLPAVAWTRQGSRMSNKLGFQEVYDATLEPEGWTGVKFKDAKWPQAVVTGRSYHAPYGNVSKRAVPQLKEQVLFPTEIISLYDCPPLPEGTEPADMAHIMAVEELSDLTEGKLDKSERLLSEKDEAATVKIPATSGISIVLDFGREVFGTIELAFTRSHGGIVDIGYGEHLYQNRVKPDKDGVHYTDRLILRKGRQKWTGFEPRGFRFVQIELRDCPKPVAISRIAVREFAYPVEFEGSFECNDHLLTDVWKAGVETARLSMQDTFIDSPWRERAQWWDNAYIASKTAYYAFADTKLLAQGLKQIADSQDRSGAVLAVYPSSAKHMFPDFGALWVMSVWDYFSWTSDKRFLTSIFPAVAKWMRWIGQFRNEDGLVNNVEGDVFIDWGEIDRRGEIVALNCLYIGALESAAKMADELRSSTDAEELRKIASKARASLAKHFWSQKHGLYVDARVEGKLEEHFSRQTNTLAALYDIPDHYQKASIFRQVMSDKGLPPISTPYFAYFVMEALFSSGYAEDALHFIKRKWGEMVEVGATAFWEYFEPEGTLCQASASAPAYLLQAHVLGVKSEGSKISIEPQPGNLTWAKGNVPTAFGIVNVDWHIGRNGFEMKVVVPKGARASIVPPMQASMTRVLLNGRDTTDVVIEVGPGTHRIRVVRETLTALKKRANNRKQEVEAPLPTPIPANRTDLEFVQEMIQILAEIEKEAALRPQIEVEEIQSGEKKSRRRRGRRRGGKEEEPVVAETSEEAVVAQPEAEEAKPEKRGRSRRRSRRGAKEEVAVEAQVTVEAEAQPEVEAAPAAESVEQPAPKRSRSRRRSRRGSREEAVAEAQPTAEAAAEDIAEPVAETETVEQPPAKRSRSRRRGRRGTREEAVVEVQTAPETEVQPVVEAEPVAAEPVAETTERRSRSRRRPRRAPKEEVAAVEPVAEVSPEPIAVETPAETEAAPEKRHRRSRSRRRRPAVDAEAPTEVIQEAAPVVEPVAPVQDVTSTDEKPAPRRRSTRSRRPAQPKIEAEPISAQPQPEPMAVAQPEPEATEAPKPRTRRRRKPAADASAAETSVQASAEPVAEAPPETSEGNGTKPKRRTRRPRKAAEETAE